MSTIAVESAIAGKSHLCGERLLEVPEDQWFDRKSRRVAPKDLADTLIGMGNAEGGSVVVGLSDGRVEGTDGDPKLRNRQIQAAIGFSDPPVRCKHRLVKCRTSDGQNDHLLVLDVEAGELVHANRKDEVYLRIGDVNKRLTFQQRQELIYDKGQQTFEAGPVSGATTELLERPLLDEYAEALGHPDPIRLLGARGLATDSGGLTVAGCLLFAQGPQQFLPEAYIRVLRYRGAKRGTGQRQQLLSDVRCEGPIPQQLFKAQEEIAVHQPVRRAMQESGRFGPVPLVPTDAWLEGVVNAVVHRSYSLSGDHIRVEIFEDRIEISSPGRFPGLVNLSDPLRATRFARNPRIARVCADLSFGQELGEGIRRMFEEMRAAGLVDPMYHQSSAGVHLTLSTEPADRELEARLPVEARLITGALREAGRLSTGEIEELIGRSRPATIRRLRALEEAGLIGWVGKAPQDPRAYWEMRPT